MKKPSDNKVEFITSENEHYYPSPKKKGIWYPSITTLLSIYPHGVGLNRWLAAQSSWEASQEVLKAAGKRGTKVHEATQLLEQGSELFRDSYSLEEYEMLMGFVEWHNLFKPKMIHMEKSLVSDRMKTGGTVDRIYEINGKTILLDIKTSSAVHDNYWIQVAAYAKLVKEKLGITVDATAILRLRQLKGNTKTRFEYKAHDKEEYEFDFEEFPRVQFIWNRLNPKAGPKILEIPTTLKL